MNSFPALDSWQIPQAAWSASFEEMARDGREGNEGVALWLGQRHEDIGTVSQVVILRGSGIVKQPAFLEISSALMNDVTDVAIELGVVLLGQIHAHGPGWAIDLSYTDRKFGIAHPGYLSVVAPDYGLRPDVQPAECGVHVFMANVGFVRLDDHETAQRVLLVDRPVDAPILVGS